MNNDDEAPAPYKIGYRKPPKSGQFKKGQSGNPKGKEKGTMDLMSLLERALKTQVIINENGQRRQITKKEAIVLQIVNKAASGDPRAIQQFLNLAMVLEGRDGSDNKPTDLPISEADREILQQIAGRMQTIKDTQE